MSIERPFAPPDPWTPPTPPAPEWGVPTPQPNPNRRAWAWLAVGLASLLVAIGVAGATALLLRGNEPTTASSHAAKPWEPPLASVSGYEFRDPLADDAFLARVRAAVANIELLAPAAPTVIEEYFASRPGHFREWNGPESAGEAVDGAFRVTGIASSSFASSWASVPALDAIDLSASARGVEGTLLGASGPGLGVQRADGSGYLLTLSPGYSALIAFDATGSEPLTSDLLPVPFSATGRLRLLVATKQSGTELKGYLDGREIISARAPQTKGAYIGVALVLYTDIGSPAVDYDEVVVKKPTTDDVSPVVTAWSVHQVLHGEATVGYLVLVTLSPAFVESPDFNGEAVFHELSVGGPTGEAGGGALRYNKLRAAFGSDKAAVLAFIDAYPG